MSWEQIEHAYHGARERTGQERARFSDEQCGSDAGMRRQLEALLEHDDAPSGLLNRPALEVAVSLRSLGSVVRGRRIGAYEVLAPLGAGGMGEVYRARDAKLHREVALKFLPADVRADPEHLARFAREARTLAALNHPNIGAIYALAEADGLQALVLELVEGAPLGA